MTNDELWYSLRSFLFYYLLMSSEVTDIKWIYLDRGWKPLPQVDDEHVGAASSRDESIMSSGFCSFQ